MPAPVLNASARIMCAHGGQVTLIPKQVQVLVGGAPAMRVGDVMGSPVVGCPIPPTPATKPCTMVVSEIPVPMVGMAPMVLAVGKPVLLQGLQGLTDGVPPAPIVVAYPGQVQVQA